MRRGGKNRGKPTFGIGVRVHPPIIPRMPDVCQVSQAQASNGTRTIRMVVYPGATRVLHLPRFHGHEITIIVIRKQDGD